MESGISSSYRDVEPEVADPRKFYHGQPFCQKHGWGTWKCDDDGWCVFSHDDAAELLTRLEQEGQTLSKEELVCHYAVLTFNDISETARVAAEHPLYEMSAEVGDPGFWLKDELQRLREEQGPLSN